MFIDRIFFEVCCDDKSNLVSINDEQIRFYSDLYDRYQTMIEIDLTEKIFPYEILIDKVFYPIINAKQLADIEWILFPRTGLLWDGLYASSELFIKNRYQLNNKIVDIRECGSLCVFRAFEIALQFQFNNKSKTIMIVSIERKINSTPYVGALILRNLNNNFKVIDARIVYINSNVEEEINKYIEKHGIDKINLMSIMMINADSSLIYKTILKIKKDGKDSFKKVALIVNQEARINSAGFLLLQIG